MILLFRIFRITNLNRLWIGVFIVFGIIGCKKLVTVDAPLTSVNQANVYGNDASAIAVLTGIYTAMSTPGSVFTGSTGISFFSGLSADELTLYSGISNTSSWYSYYTNSLYSTTKGTVGSDYWSPAYNYIYTCNAAIEGISNSTAITVSIKQQLLGESYFMRAFIYFYLANLFGDAPLITTTDYKTNESLSRAPKPQIYQQVITDLKTAEGLLNASYLDGNLQVYSSGNVQKVRPTKWAAMALLARTYLYIKDWADAENESDSLINNPTFSLSSIGNVFLANSSEAIWQLQPINSELNTQDAWVFILPSSGPNANYPVYLSNQLLGKFEPGDLRRFNWIDSVIVGNDTFYYPYKYKSAAYGAPLTEYLMVFRLGEQYLIRAEARAQQNDLTGAQADIDVIRARSMLGNTTSGDYTSLLSSILHERQVELFTEWGHRWLDLKRTSSVDSVMTYATPIKSAGLAWNSFQQLYPILYTDILEDRNLIQNQGYGN
ncbi:MAG: RagB/SusD family nutrient uptake outer membrane protein [Puia sp.]|nr:RagB/SusD family nutrient uptake outer membrane protein [Puia sp.]